MKLYNTLTRGKEELRPLTHGEVRMYVCGITPYDYSHIGHARSAIAFDVIRRYLRFKGYRVTFVKNYTDIEDKIIRRAAEEGVDFRLVSERYIAAYREEMAALNVLPGDIEPKATEHIPQMLRLIERLVADGVAYVVEGDVYFEVRRFPPYGRLSGKNLDELLAGARVEVDERKRDPRDFALWKAAKPDEPSWPSPWGPGRPGWHIECSAMAMQYLGETLDIHGGGADLVFPHHECEIAQSEAATKQPFTRYWLHNGFVNMGADKMSKSLGNTLTIRDLIARYDPAALRLFLVGAHYRGPVDWAEERVVEAERALERLWAPVAELDARGGAEASAGAAERPLSPELDGFRARFVEAMDDDFNTAQGLGVLFELSRALRTGQRGAADQARGVEELCTLAGTLGIERPRRAGPSAEVAERIEALVRQRTEARRARDFRRADALRAEIEALGAVLEDTPAGTSWKPRG